MTIDFSLLDPTFAILAQKLIDTCAEQGLTMTPTAGFRTLDEENKIWRRSRATWNINDQIAKLRMQGCNFLADSLQNVGPQANAPEGTNTIGGLSWHNWGQAMDCLIIVNGQIVEDGEAMGYKKYGGIAKQLGLRWGGDFTKPDAGHVQLNPKEIPQLYTIKQVNDHFASLNN